MAPEKKPAKTVYPPLNKCKFLQRLGRMRLILLPVYICQCDTFRRHLQVDGGCFEGSRGLQRGGHSLLHGAGACQHLSGDGV